MVSRKGKESWIRKHPFISSILLLFILIFIILLTFPAADTNFYFSYEENNMSVNGEVYFDGEYFGNTEEGKISVPYFEDLPQEMTFKGKYDGIEFEYLYTFPTDYSEYLEYGFLVTNVNPNIELIFYDNETNCKLNGDVYLENNFLGNSKDGIVYLSKKDYDSLWKDGEFKINGTTDSCFGTNKNLPFVEYWQIDEDDLEYYFETNESAEFVAELTPRSPRYFEEMQGFVRPSEAESYFSQNIEKYFKSNDSEENLDKISEFSIRYGGDSMMFSEGEYWQTPAEVLSLKHGDYEDWAISTLSLMRAYNSSLKCYDALWDTHISIICFLEKKVIIYDQKETKYSINLKAGDLSESEKKSRVRQARNNYFDAYGLKPLERMLYSLFNEKELIVFEDEEDFVDMIVEKMY